MFFFGAVNLLMPLSSVLGDQESRTRLKIPEVVASGRISAEDEGVLSELRGHAGEAWTPPEMIPEVIQAREGAKMPSNQKVRIPPVIHKVNVAKVSTVLEAVKVPEVEGPVKVIRPPKFYSGIKTYQAGTRPIRQPEKSNSS